MLMALLKGKLSREQENMEDILTSNVFGLLGYLPAERGLLPFLACAENQSGERPLACLAKPTIPADQQVSYEFWPWMEATDCFGCEPDVLLRIPRSGDNRLLVLVEAKYLSGKSSEASDEYSKPTDQLAREWDNLVRVAERESSEPVLIYLTADMAYPTVDIMPSVEEYEAKRPDAARPTILWLTWRRIADVFGSTEERILQDLVLLVKRLNLTAFEGFSPIHQTAGLEWRFEPPGFDWNVTADVVPITWRYCGNG